MKKIIEVTSESVSGLTFTGKSRILKMTRGVVITIPLSMIESTEEDVQVDWTDKPVTRFVITEWWYKKNFEQPNGDKLHEIISKNPDSIRT